MNFKELTSRCPKHLIIKGRNTTHNKSEYQNKTKQRRHGDVRALEQVLVHLFCFLLSPFLCAGPDRILIESKQFINLKSCLRLAIQLVKTFNAHLLVSYWKKKSEVVKLSKKPFGQTLFSFFLFVCLLLKESHMIIILLPSFLVRFFFLIKNLLFLASFTVLAQKMRPSNSTIISHV